MRAKYAPQTSANGEIEAQYTQYVYKNTIGIQTKKAKDPKFEYRNQIMNLSRYFDKNGELKENISEEELKNHIFIILEKFKLSKTYSNEKYKYDSDRTALSNFENLRTITKNCR